MDKINKKTIKYCRGFQFAKGKNEDRAKKSKK